MPATFFKGDTVDVSLTIKDKSTGVAVDLSTATVKLRIGQQIGVAAAYEQSMTLGGTVGTATHAVPAATTLNFNGTYYITVRVVEQGGRAYTAIQDQITFTDIVLAPPV